MIRYREKTWLLSFVNVIVASLRAATHERQRLSMGDVFGSGLRTTRPKGPFLEGNVSLVRNDTPGPEDISNSYLFVCGRRWAPETVPPPLGLHVERVHIGRAPQVASDSQPGRVRGLAKLRSLRACESDRERER